MSRHTVSHRTNPNQWLIIGFDAPLGTYFFQLWDDTNPDAPIEIGEVDSLDGLKKQTVIPQELQDLLTAEVLGQVDTQAMKDCRIPTG